MVSYMPMTALLQSFPSVLAALEKPTDFLRPWEFRLGAPHPGRRAAYGPQPWHDRVALASMDTGVERLRTDRLAPRFVTKMPRNDAPAANDKRNSIA